MAGLVLLYRHNKTLQHACLLCDEQNVSTLNVQ